MFKMKPPTFFNSTPLKQKDKKDPYTKEDDKFLEEQHEERVKRSDFDEGSIQQKMFDCNHNPKTRWDNVNKKCVPKESKK